MADPKPKKRRATDYAGIAALVTAIGGVVALLLSQSHSEDRTALMQDSLLAVMQYRLDELGADVGDLADEVVKLRIALAALTGSGVGAGVYSSPPDEPEANPVVEIAPDPVEEPERALESVVKKVREKRALGGAELRELVQQIDRPLTAEDLEPGR